MLLCDLGGYLNDDLAICCGIAFMDLECGQPEVTFIFCWVHALNTLSFLSWNQFCYSSLLCEFRINHSLAAFCGNFYSFWPPISLTFVYLCWIIHIVCHWWPWKFCCVENFPMASEDDKIDLSSVAVTDVQNSQGLYSLRRRRLTCIGIPIINLRRSDDPLRFIMGIPILIRRRLLSE